MKKLPNYDPALVEKVKQQLDEMKKPLRRKGRQRFPTVKDYEKMDPFWMSTMGGKFAGRMIKRAAGDGK